MRVLIALGHLDAFGLFFWAIQHTSGHDHGLCCCAVRRLSHEADESLLQLRIDFIGDGHDVYKHIYTTSSEAVACRPS